MKSRLDTLVSGFEDNVKGVHKLIEFDRDVLEIAITGVRDLSEKLKRHHQLDNPHLSAEKTLSLLQGIRKNDSLRPRYKVIFNQAIVLLVSYFGSTVEDIFKLGIDALLESDQDSDLLREEVKLTFKEMKESGWSLRESAPDLLVIKKDLSFQDMQAIGRAFKTYLSINIEKDINVNNIILSQACRHVIVHAGGIANERTIKQLSNATPRNVKPNIGRGEHIQFTPNEVEDISSSMKSYVGNLAANVREVLNARI